MTDQRKCSFGLKLAAFSPFDPLIRSVVKPHMTNDWAFAVYGNRAILQGGKRANAGMRRLDAGSGDPHNALAPRTALGLSADGKTLVVLAVDGRQPGYSAEGRVQPRHHVPR